MNTEQYELRYHPDPCRHPDADMFVDPTMTFASLTCIRCGEVWEEDFYQMLTDSGEAS
jgi:hypothetical protein